MIYFNLVQGIGCDMLCCLFQITNTACIFMQFNDGIQTLFCYYAFFCLEAHAFQNFRKNVFGEDDLLLF